MLLAAISVAVPRPVSAAPTLTGKRAEAVRVKAQLETLDQQVDAASDDYHEALARYRRVSRAAARSKAEITVLRRAIHKLQTRLSGRVEGMYRTGPYGFLDVLLGARSFEEFSTTWNLLTDINRREARDVAALKAARRRKAVAEKRLLAEERDARAALRVMGDRRASVEARFAARRGLLAGLEEEIATLEREQREAQLAAARTRAAREAERARARERARSAFAAIFGGDDEPSRPARDGVVDVAMRYLGRPYAWGAAGPDSFDCSGFTMYVYGQVGVSLPHSSRAQIGYGERISRDDLAPGDLVFFGRRSIHHVGIYVGGGRYIHSPHTGDVVSIDSLWGRGDFAGACRP